MQVAGQPVDAVDVQGIAFPEVVQAGHEAGTPGILATACVSEGLVQRDPFELTGGVLVDTAHADVADVLPVHGRSFVVFI